MLTGRHNVLPAVLLFVFVRCYTTQAYYQRRPNIVFILADDLGWNDVGFHNPDIISPNLDLLARNGIILNQSYVQPACSPSRAALMTGVYPFRLGLQGVNYQSASAVSQSCPRHDEISKAYCNPGSSACMSSFRPDHFATSFQQNGYATHMIGKWHLGFCDWQCTPTYRGFDSFYGFYNAVQDYYSKTTEGYYDYRDDEDVDFGANGTYSGYLYARRVKSIIKNHDNEQPLFLYLAPLNVHSPLQVPKRYYNMYPHVQDENRRMMSGMVTAMDDVIGVTVRALKKREMFDNTLFVFSSDNGGVFTLGSYNTPLRGGKLSLFEGGTRAAGFVSGSMLPRKGVEYNGLFHIVDWFPTLVEAAGLNYHNCDQDGVSQWKSLTSLCDEPSPRNEVVYNLDQSKDPMTGAAAIRVGNYKLIEGYPGILTGWYKPGEEVEITPKMEAFTQVMDERQRPEYRAIIQQDAIEGNKDPANRFLFNLKDDPYEYVNLYDKEPEIVAQLQDRLACHRTCVVEPNFPPTSPEADPARHGGIWSPGWC